MSQERGTSVKDPRLGTPARYTPGQRVLFSSGAHRHRPGIVSAVQPERRGVAEKYSVSYRFYLPPPISRKPVSPSVVCLSRQLILVLDDELSMDEFLRMTPPEVESRYFNS